MTSMWNDPELIRLVDDNIPLIDVRAPKEFLEGAIPGSINLPIMNDEERHLVGTCYKEKGQEEAIKLGHSLVSGKNKEGRIELWRKQISEFPETEVFCFRGGLRSQIACQWINEAGFNKKPISGGYKRLRKFYLSWLDEAPHSPLIRIGGYTGSGKTRILKQTKNFIDLEEYAHHRGSAFGPRGVQPSQITFENLIARDLIRLRDKKIVVEDESATLGKVALPTRFFAELRNAPLVILEISQEERLQNIFEDYVQHQSAEFFIKNLDRIVKRIGHKKVQSLSEEITAAYQAGTATAHSGWIKQLLDEYYDPLYQKDLKFNQEKVIFRGNREEVLAFVENF